MVKITTQSEGSVVVINVAGRVDGLSAPELDDVLQKEIKDKSHKLVVDMTGTEFMSSAGMRALLKARLAVQDKHGDLRLAGLTDYILDSLKLVGLDKLFKIYKSAPEAVASF